MKRLILASASPRRKEILGKTGLEFEIIVSDCDENIDEKQPDKLVMELSKLKASDIASKNPDALVIGADTVVSHKGLIMGKPKTREEAIKMIQNFADDIHQVYTGITLIIPATTENENEQAVVKEKIQKTLEDFEKRYGKKISYSVSEDSDAYPGKHLTVTYNVCTDVHVLPMTEEEICRYVDTGEPMDKAGAYAIQGMFAPYISKIDGDYYNVVGLPISSVYSILKEFT